MKSTPTLTRRNGPKLKGIYALEIWLNQDIWLIVGALGELCFKKGKYFYVGSAQNSLENRVKRHLRKEKKNFWHIDYLLTSDAALVTKVLLREAGKEYECKLAEELNRLGKPVAKFGCSDCSCKSHLFNVVEDSEALQHFTQIFNLTQN